ncbi:type IV toxin-antitoxin system AbiEi family antitoxin domain-containing protein [Pyrococcus yayanosii]|uniref:AbiEi antitoxin C-terminal domain-containing protein n=1 Tax=Pyrococcus yayanosii (strain CH1 / JCM 16557) TaxID=529709 RepID=F8AGR2_PYRYC|nr:hypothetical protein [Pyrococcus yayanosii]AEH25198.1 hypothetical protein PYCH_15320 [Pyrococcus yayanosii CH1]
MRPITQILLAEFGGKVITKEDLEKLSTYLKVDDVDYLVNYLIQYGYIIRILRGLYYVKTPVEFSFKSSPTIYKLLSLGMNKVTKNWYFGLFTALVLNGLTHEHYTTIFIINDKIARTKIIRVNGTPVRIIKTKRKLFDFGIVEKGDMKISDLEKILLDFLYFGNYGTISKELALRIWREYKDSADWKKLKKYLEKYPESIAKVVGDVE